MMMNWKSFDIKDNVTTKKSCAATNRHSEQGAALITAIIFSTLLLLVGSALVVTTEIASTTAIDSTTEVQAYYAAEAGIESALAVLRKNVTNAAGNTATFRTAANNPSLSSWLTYTNGFVNFNSTACSQCGYSLNIIDPDNTAAAATPDRLLIVSTGRGPYGASKVLQMLVKRLPFDFPVSAPIVIRGSDNGTPMFTFDLGNSNPRRYTGNDAAGMVTDRPAVAVSYHDRVVAATAIGNGIQVNDPKLGILDYNSATYTTPFSVTSTNSTPITINISSTTETPWFLTTADNARAFINDVKEYAQSQDRYMTSLNGFSGSRSPYKPEFTFVNGNCSLDGGAGLLIVTGDLTLTGNDGFDGVILVLGNGKVTRSGGGGGNTYGSFMVANFSLSGTTGFGVPHFDVSGGGNSLLQSDSVKENEARESVGLQVVGIVER
jgi:hypothetical protein